MWLHYFQVNTRLFKVPIHIDNGPEVTLALSPVTGLGQTFNYTNKQQRNSRTTGNLNLKLKLESDPDQISVVCKRQHIFSKNSIAFPVTCVVYRHGMWGVHLYSVYTLFWREIPTPGWLRPELPVPGSAWVCERRNKLLTFKRFYGYTLHMKGLPNQSVHLKMSQGSWGRHIETLFIDS